MPIYEYKCENGHVFDVIQKMIDEPLTECEECGAPAVRVLTAPAIHFKGSGFYNTDYGKKKKGGGASPDSGSSSEGSSESSSSDSKSSDSGSTDASKSSTGSKAATTAD